jgi:hypothetical protein
MHAFCFCAHRRGVEGTPDTLARGVGARAELDQVARVVSMSFL